MGPFDDDQELEEGSSSRNGSDWAGLSWGRSGGSLKSSRGASSQQLHSFRGSTTYDFFWWFPSSNFSTGDVCLGPFLDVQPAMQSSLKTSFPLSKTRLGLDFDAEARRQGQFGQLTRQ